MGEIVRRYREQLSSLPEQHALSGQSAKRLLRLLRLAVLITHRRNPDLEPSFTLQTNNEQLTLSLDADWLTENPLTAAELEIEANRQSDMGWPLTIATS